MDGYTTGLLIGLLANVGAELLLVFELGRSWRLLTRCQIVLKAARWAGCLAGCSALGGLGLSFEVVLLCGLFSVTAATDFETTILPPDWFVYGSVLASFIVGFMRGGWLGFSHVVLAQAACFAGVVLAVRFVGLCDSGDIKLGMQYGAVCGSLMSAMVGGFFFWLAACLVVAVVAVAYVMQARSLKAVARVASFQPPLGPLLWCGMLGSFVYFASRVGAV